MTSVSLAPVRRASPLARAGLALAAAFTLLTGAPARTEARCAPPAGDELVPVTTTPLDGAILLERRATYRRSSTLIRGDSPSTITLRRAAPCTDHCVAHLRLEPLAPNLARLDVAQLAVGRWRLASAGTSGTIDITRRRPRAPHTTPTAPSAPSPHVVRQGTTRRAFGFTLGAAPPADVVGVLATWPGSSFFMALEGDRRELTLSPNSCGPRPPGFEAPASGAVVELAFVDAAGRLSPTTRVTLP